MKIIYTKSFDNTRKKLKKHIEEQQRLIEIIDFIKNHDSFEKMISNPLIKMFHFERLKYNLNEFYSFRLSKNGGLIRLIVYYNFETDSVDLVYISLDHYEDFDGKKVIYYDE